MLAEESRVFEIEFVESNDSIDRLPTGEVADCVDDGLSGQFFGHEEKLVDGFTGPVAVAQFLDGEEQNATTEVLARAQKFLAFFVGGDAEDGDGPRLGQEASEKMFCHENGGDARHGREITWLNLPQGKGIAGTGPRGGTRRLHYAGRREPIRNADPDCPASRAARAHREAR